MALYIPHSIFHLARLLYVRPETFGPYYVCVDMHFVCARVKSAAVRTTNHHFTLHNALRNIAQNIWHMYTFFENDLLPTTVRGNTCCCVSHVFKPADQNAPLILCEFLVGASRIVAGAVHPTATRRYEPAVYLCQNILKINSDYYPKQQ